MKYLFDTCTCVFLIRNRSQAIQSRIESCELGQIVVSSITEAELRYGADKSQDPPKNHGLLDRLLVALPVIDFGSKAAQSYGEVRSELERRGQVIGPLDMLIAAHALSQNLEVITNNLSEFSRVPGLAASDWS